MISVPSSISKFRLRPNMPSQIKIFRNFMLQRVQAFEYLSKPFPNRLASGDQAPPWVSQAESNDSLSSEELEGLDPADFAGVRALLGAEAPSFPPPGDRDCPPRICTLQAKYGHP